MKPLVNSYNDHKLTQQSGVQAELSLKRLAELMSQSKDRQAYIDKLEAEMGDLTSCNAKLDQQIKEKEAEYESVKGKAEEEKVDQQEEHEMNNWIQNVQKMNGLPQESIDCLISMEYEGAQQQICLSCYVELKNNELCKYLPCCHLFHAGCIDNHLKVNRMCPACQEQVVI